MVRLAQRAILAMVFGLYIRWMKLSQWARVRSERVPRVETDESIEAPGPDVAIVVKYGGHGEGDNLHILLDALKRAGVSTLLVCNGRLSPEEREQLRHRVSRVVTRRNVGRDFGAYRSATLLLSQSAQPRRVMYFNDSLLYIEGPELDQLIARFSDSSFDVVGLGENQSEHHVGSFALAMSGEVFRHERLRRFWTDYRPYDIRLHAIHQGEIQLSKAIKATGCSIDVVYGVVPLARRLQALSLSELVQAVRCLPQLFRGHFERHLLADLSQSRGRIAELFSSDTEAHREPATLEGDACAQQFARAALIDLILNQVTSGSQLHLGFGLSHLLMGCPVVKRDLFARGLYREHDCAEILSRLPEPTRQRLLRDLINKGRFDMERGRWNSLLYRHGLK